MADVALTVHDGSLEIVEDGATARQYLLRAQIDGTVAANTAAELGPALNALYAAALSAAVADPTLGGLVQDVREDAGDEDGGGASLEIEFADKSAIDGGQGPTAGFRLHLAIPYDQSHDGAMRREPVLAALGAAVELAAVSSTIDVRERVLAAVNAHVAGLYGGPIPRNPDRPIQGADGLVQRDGDHTPDHASTGRTTYRSPIVFEIVAPDTATLETRVQGVIAALRAASVTRLGGLAVDVEEVDTDPDVIDQAYAGPGVQAGVRGTLTWATRPNDPYTEAD